MNRHEELCKVLDEEYEELSDKDKINYMDTTRMLDETRPVQLPHKRAKLVQDEEEEEEQNQRVDILEESETMRNDPVPTTLAFYDKDIDEEAESLNGSDTDDQPVRVEHKGIVRSGFFVTGDIMDLLHTHQLMGMDKMLTNMSLGRGSLLAHGVGTGKTLTALATLSTYMSGIKSARAIVVSPKSLILQWHAEIERFQSVLHLRGFVVLDPSHLDRVSAEWRKHGGTGVLLINPELFQRKWSTIRIKSDTVVVVDEAHLHLKRDTNLFFKAVKALLTDHRILLTGTPIQNSLAEYYNMISLVDPALLASKETFRDTFQNPIVNSAQHDAGEKEIRDGKIALKTLMAKIDPVVSFASADELLTEVLPKKTEVVILHKYKDDDDDDDEEEEETLNSFQQLSNLRNKSMPTKVAIAVDLIDAIRGAGDERTIVFSQRIDTLKTIAKMRAGSLLIGEANKADERQLMIDDFCATPRSILYISLMVGGTGLHLPSASRVILVDVSWNPMCDTQAVARAYRLGQEKEVFVYRLCAKDTIEMDAYALSINKFKLASTITDDKDVGRVYTEEDLYTKLKNILPSTEEEKAALSFHLKMCDPILATAMQSTNVLDVIDHDRAIFAREDDASISQPDAENNLNFKDMQLANPSPIHDSEKFVTPMRIAVVTFDCTRATTDERVRLYLAPSVLPSQSNKELFKNTDYLIYRYDLDATAADDEDSWEEIGRTRVWRGKEDPIKVYVLDPQPVGKYMYACRIVNHDAYADGERSLPSAIITVVEEEE